MAVTKKPAAKKEAATKTVAKKAAAPKTVKAEAKTATKTVAKKAAKPAVEKKVAAKPVAEKKPAAKKAAKKATVAKMSVQDYCDKINWKKGEAQFAGKLYMEISASDLVNEFENGVSNLTTAKKAVKECLLIGDEILTSTRTDLTVRYYVDNLSPERAKYSD